MSRLAWKTRQSASGALWMAALDPKRTLSAKPSSGRNIARDKVAKMNLVSRFFARRSKGQVTLSIPSREDVEKLLGSGRYQDAAVQLAAMAHGNDPWAQFTLAQLVANGLGGNKDESRAAALFRAAAEGGYAPAQSALGFMYLNGRSLPRDLKAGIEWTARAAESGDARAQFNLAKAYNEGAGVETDHVAAARWMKRSADGGLSAGRLGLAIWTLTGNGVTRDPRRAVDLLKPLVESGNIEAGHWMEKALSACSDLPQA